MAKTYWKAIAIVGICTGSLTGFVFAQGGGELRFCLRMEPKTFDPLKVEDEASATIRYLTGGVLVRVNRQTQELEPELAQGWKVSKDGRQITFRLRSGVSFSDGTPFSAGDVAYTVQQLMDPALHSATGDAFRSGSHNHPLHKAWRRRTTIRGIPLAGSAKTSAHRTDTLAWSGGTEDRVPCPDHLGQIPRHLAVANWNTSNNIGHARPPIYQKRGTVPLCGAPVF